jgi:hypothetical protein
MNPAMRKCAELLREMSKLPQAAWFLEPVDPIKLNIPDYPKIIRTPMDFSTIRNNIESGFYESIDAFAEDVRLVFRNAITFNAARDNIVNISAREVSTKFEDRYRVLVTQLDVTSYMPLPPEPKLNRSTSSNNVSKKMKGRSSVSSFTPRSNLPGPRQPYNLIPAAAIDPNSAQLIELQRQVESLKGELVRLKSAVTEQEVSKSVQEAK